MQPHLISRSPFWTQRILCFRTCRLTALVLTTTSSSSAELALAGNRSGPRRSGGSFHQLPIQMLTPRSSGCPLLLLSSRPPAGQIHGAKPIGSISRGLHMWVSMARCLELARCRPPHSHVVPAVLILFDCGDGGVSRWLVPALRADRIGYHFLAQEQVFSKVPSQNSSIGWECPPRKCATSERCPCQGATPTVTSTCPWSGGGGGTLRTGAYAVLTIFIGGSGCTGSPTQIYRLDPSKSTLPWQVLYVLWITTSILQAQDVTCLGTQAVVPIIVAFHPTGHDVRHWVDLLAQACALQVISHAVPILLGHQAMDRLGRCFVDNRLRHQIELTLNAWGGHEISCVRKRQANIILPPQDFLDVHVM